MHALLPMLTPLRSLDVAVAEGNIHQIHVQAARLVPGIGALYATPMPTGTAGRRQMDQFGGPVALVAERVCDRIRSMGTVAGLAGLPWDGTWLLQLLELLLRYLKPHLSEQPPAGVRPVT